MTDESKDNKHTEQRDKRQHPLPPQNDWLDKAAKEEMQKFSRGIYS